MITRQQENPSSYTYRAFRFYSLQTNATVIFIYIAKNKTIQIFKNPPASRTTSMTHHDLRCFFFLSFQFFFSIALCPVMSPLIPTAVRNTEDGDYANSLCCGW